eukprot:Rhum_TRINITY_DN10481_c0_g1::Rhum_TRINITY_DN10481_c0_g1_i1::g.38622::m.38622
MVPLRWAKLLFFFCGGFPSFFRLRRNEARHALGSTKTRHKRVVHTRTQHRHARHRHLLLRQRLRRLRNLRRVPQLVLRDAVAHLRHLEGRLLPVDHDARVLLRSLHGQGHGVDLRQPLLVLARPSDHHREHHRRTRLVPVHDACVLRREGQGVHREAEDVTVRHQEAEPFAALRHAHRRRTADDVHQHEVRVRDAAQRLADVEPARLLPAQLARERREVVRRDGADHVVAHHVLARHQADAQTVVGRPLRHADDERVRAERHVVRVHQRRPQPRRQRAHPTLEAEEACARLLCAHFVRCLHGARSRVQPERRLDARPDQRPARCLHRVDGRERRPQRQCLRVAREHAAHQALRHLHRRLPEAAAEEVGHRLVVGRHGGAVPPVQELEEEVPDADAAHHEPERRGPQAAVEVDVAACGGAVTRHQLLLQAELARQLQRVRAGAGAAEGAGALLAEDALVRLRGGQPAADLGRALEHDDLGAGGVRLAQLVGGDHAGHAAADDDDALARVARRPGGNAHRVSADSLAVLRFSNEVQIL